MQSLDNRWRHGQNGILDCSPQEVLLVTVSACKIKKFLIKIMAGQVTDRDQREKSILYMYPNTSFSKEILGHKTSDEFSQVAVGIRKTECKNFFVQMK